MDISRVEIFCDDKQVGLIMRMVAGHALVPPKVHPVVNAELRNGEIVAKSKATNGELMGLFSAYLVEHNLRVINAANVKAFLKSIGKSQDSYSYVLRQAQDRGIVRKRGGKGNKTGYDVAGGLFRQAKKKAAH